MMKLLSRALLFGPKLIAIWLWCISRSQAQTSTAATTDPSEVIALNSMFQKWGLSSPAEWNITGDPCTGSAVDDNAVPITSDSINPAIKCVCKYKNGTTCHIIALKVYALSVKGGIPEELGKFTELYDLNLARNYLTGPLPAFIGNLAEMQYLTFGVNALSGQIPKEIGNLRKLFSLGIGSNNFSGPLPNEFGNLVNLEQLYMDSSGVGGRIPSTLANLVNLKTVWASDCPFNGTIPDFIGTWTKLDKLRLRGNSFHGSIPSSFFNLTSLTDLRISDISNGSSSLDFIKNMKSLSTLILRNNMISGTIPLNIGEYESLQELDLSFNNLSGEIPSSLFSLNNLIYLFLGNNSLSGPLPTSKSSSLVNLDLSYNQLSGSFPPWVLQSSFQLNLVANNFIFDTSNSSIFPGLNCLQRGFPCHRGFPIYSEFAIKCGGESFTSSARIYYERDNSTLGPASYYVTDTKRWAVSNTGRFLENNNGTYIANTFSQFTNTLDPVLFQSARLSPASLRYYGLGLENGNYTVKLQFAEISFVDTPVWTSLGRRVFDVYIQGSLVLENFDIRKAAGGVSLRAVERTFDVRVSENFLEIHLFWSGKGTCCLPSQGSYGPSISAISVKSDFVATVTNQAPTATSPKKNNAGMIVGISLSGGVVLLLSVIGACILIQKKGVRKYEGEELQGLSAHTYSYNELKNATEDFNPTNKLGEGGFGFVYKGALADGTAVAVKQLSVASDQGKSQFVTEIATISAVQHRNLVKLYGCCIEGDNRLLVYEYLENKSLDKALFGQGSLFLAWPKRFDICLGTARGLAYLHEESRLRIVHRDVKASNILLDADLNAKISDFGLAKLYDDKKTHITTGVAGTIGYLAPEYAMRGHLTEKADVFAFGVVALEIVSGRPSSDTSLEKEKIYLLEWAWYLNENKCALELVDPKLHEFSEAEALRVIGVSLLCTQASPGQRPPMSRVVAMLSGDIDVGSVTAKPGYLTDWQFEEITSFANSDTSGLSTVGHTNSPFHASSSASTNFVRHSHH